MKKISCFDKCVTIEGIYGFDSHHKFRRYTDAIIDKYPRLKQFDRRCTGARLRFCTDSETVRIEMHVSDVYVDRGMSFYQANVGYVFVGDYSDSEYVSLVTADDTYKSDVISAEFNNKGKNDITVFFPRNSCVENIDIYIDDTAEIYKPSPHKAAAPFVFYGSSITEQGHTSTVNAYPSLLSRFFDADFYNFGASGNALGELEIAEYLAKIPKSIFFYDYDHNAPSLEHLAETHERFFKKFREYDPFSAVIMTGRPADDTTDFHARQDIIRQTYLNAISAGDDNVYFISGSQLFGDVSPAICTTDRTHPNDLGHYLIAKTLQDFIICRDIQK